MAVRLMLSGAGAAHQGLHLERERWIQEYRALATGIGGAGVWLEKVSVKTSPVASGDDMQRADAALGGLLGGLQNLEFDEAALDALAEELTDLRQKLPPELLSGDDPYDPAGPEQLQDVLEDVRSLLLNRLLSAAPEP